jgi:hypothetical protein
MDWESMIGASGISQFSLPVKVNIINVIYYTEIVV